MDYQLHCEEKIGAEFQGYVTLRERNLFRMGTMTMFTETTIIARLLMIMIIVVTMTMTISMMIIMVFNKDDDDKDERNGDGRDDARR